MEKKLLMVFAVALCISSADAATVYMQRKNPSMKMQAQPKGAAPSKSQMVLDSVADIYDNTIEGLFMKIQTLEKQGFPISTADFKKLTLDLKNLRGAKALLGVGGNLSPHSKPIFDIVYSAVQHIKKMPKLDQQAMAKAIEELTYIAQGIISEHYVSTNAEAGRIALKGK